MAVGSTALLLGGASLAGGAMSSRAAKKAAQGNQAAADNATALQREQFETTTRNYAPWLDAGRVGNAAYLYELGLGPRPTIGGTRPAIESFYETSAPATGGRPAPNMNSVMGQMLGLPQNATGTAGQTRTQRFRVNGQTFSTLEEAEKFADANRTGGREYQGYSQSPMARYLMEEGVDSIQGSAAAGGGLFSGATLEALEDNRRRVIQADTADYFNRLLGVSQMGMGAAGNQANAGQAFAGNVGNIQMQAAQNAGNARMQSAQAFNSTLGDMAGIYGYFGGSNPMAAYAAPTMASSPRPMANPFFGR